MYETGALIKYYFNLGMKNYEILAMLLAEHDIEMSLLTLKRKLHNLRLFRRKRFSPMDQVISFLRKQLAGSGHLHGYRWMHLKCIQNGLIVKQETIRLLLKTLDPVGCSIRKRRRLRRRQYFNKGPNYLWHIDGYDKLKPYGIAINGCIDGFSRHIMWLKVGRTNNDPQVIAGYYLNTVIKYGGIPQTIRTDMGTENGHIQQMQIFFRRNMENVSMPPFRCGASTSNQKIESWWAILRKQSAQFWMNLLGKIKDDGYFGGTDLEKCNMQFCFLKIIQAELETVATEWNAHNITSSKNSIMPRGKPFIMFNIPEMYGKQNYMISVPHDEIELTKEYCVFLEDDLPCDPDVFELCSILLDEGKISISDCPYEAVNAYIYLREQLSDLL